MLNNYKWYRKLRGGIWYRNRYIYDMGRNVVFKWERIKGNNSGGYDAYLIDTENYTTRK